MLADLAAEGTTLPPANSGTGTGTADSTGYPVAAVKLLSPSENPSNGAATPDLPSAGGDYTEELNVVQGLGQASTGSVPPEILNKVRFIASVSLGLIRSSASSAAQVEENFPRGPENCRFWCHQRSLKFIFHFIFRTCTSTRD